MYSKIALTAAVVAAHTHMDYADMLLQVVVVASALTVAVRIYMDYADMLSQAMVADLSSIYATHYATLV